MTPKRFYHDSPAPFQIWHSTFQEHTTGGPPDKSYEEAAFLERFRLMRVMEEGETLWLAWATPRAWLGQGQKISVHKAPTYLGSVAD